MAVGTRDNQVDVFDLDQPQQGIRCGNLGRPLAFRDDLDPMSGKVVGNVFDTAWRLIASTLDDLDEDDILRCLQERQGISNRTAGLARVFPRDRYVLGRK
jgi:hypothetical protein